jgi:hypothetical protein
MEAKAEEVKLQPNNTLYVRNLNEKIKLEGKYRAGLPCRDACQSVPSVLDPRRGNIGKNAGDAANERLSFHRIPITTAG